MTADNLPQTKSRSLRFSLRELVVAATLLCLLLLAASPWFHARKVRADVSRTRADMRTVATGLESYFIDNMSYPPCAMAEGVSRFQDPNAYGQLVIPAGVATANSHAPMGSGARRAVTFRIPDPAMGGNLPHSLTSPQAYLVRFPVDGFADSANVTFGYFSDHSGWIVWSPGPDRDENAPSGPADIGRRVFSTYHSHIAQPSPKLLHLAYDPTNGVVSDGDLFRVRQ